MNPAIIGALINSALYLVCVFVAGMITGHAWAWKLAIAGMGFTYLSDLVQIAPEGKGLSVESRIALVVASIVLGILAGLSLLLF